MSEKVTFQDLFEFLVANKIDTWDLHSLAKLEHSLEHKSKLSWDIVIKWLKIKDGKILLLLFQLTEIMHKFNLSKNLTLKDLINQCQKIKMDQLNNNANNNNNNNSNNSSSNNNINGIKCNNCAFINHKNTIKCEECAVSLRVAKFVDLSSDSSNNQV